MAKEYALFLINLISSRVIYITNLFPMVQNRNRERICGRARAAYHYLPHQRITDPGLEGNSSPEPADPPSPRDRGPGKTCQNRNVSSPAPLRDKGGVRWRVRE